MFTDAANAPAKVIKEFRKKHDKPVFKAAHLDASFLLSNDLLDLRKHECFAPKRGVVWTVPISRNTFCFASTSFLTKCRPRDRGDLLLHETYLKIVLSKAPTDLWRPPR